MTVTIAMKSICAAAVHSSGILGRILSRRARDVAILMYHRVVPGTDPSVRLQPGMYVSPETFDRHLAYLERNFQIIPLRDYASVLRDGKARSTKPSCVLTFDDGWRDVFLNAFPLLVRRRIPATVFLPTDYIGRNDAFWTDRLADIFDALDEQETSWARIDGPLARSLAGLRVTTYSGGDRFEKAVGILKTNRAEEISGALEELERVFSLRPGNAPGPEFLSWDEVRRMGETGLVSFGSHTASHRILTTLSKEEIDEELDRSRQMLLEKEVVDPSFIPFCYPNGDYDTGIAAMVRDRGYSLAVTTNEGWNDSGTDSFSVRRIAIHDDMTGTEALFGCRIAGFL